MSILCSSSPLSTCEYFQLHFELLSRIYIFETPHSVLADSILQIFHKLPSNWCLRMNNMYCISACTSIVPAKFREMLRCVLSDLFSSSAAERYIWSHCFHLFHDWATLLPERFKCPGTWRLFTPPLPSYDNCTKSVQCILYFLSVLEKELRIYSIKPLSNSTQLVSLCC